MRRVKRGGKGRIVKGGGGGGDVGWVSWTDVGNIFIG